MKTVFKLLFVSFLAFKEVVFASSIDTPQVKWKFETGASIRGTAILDGGRLYFGNSEGSIYCLDAESSDQIWKFETGSTITSQPAIAGQLLLVSSRGNRLYALSKDTGEVSWSFKLENPKPHVYGWDYFDASPLVTKDFILISSGNNTLYSLSHYGEVQWQFEAGDKIRATPLAVGDDLFVPSYNGIVYRLSLSDGQLKGEFETNGIKFYDTVNFWDRTAITARPALKDGVLVIGSRDGRLYGFDTGTMEKKWHVTYGASWTGSSPVIDDEAVYIGWSDALLVTAVNFKTGEEIWKTKTGARMFSTPVFDGENLYLGSFNGKIYCLNKEHGEIVWEYQTEAPVVSSPQLVDGVLYVGNDDGSFYAFENAGDSFKTVYQPVEAKPKWLFASEQITPYLENKGFQRLDTTNLKSFLLNRIADGKPSVVVFPHSSIPEEVAGSEAEDSVFKKYMEAGGRIVWLNGLPNWWSFDENRKFSGHDPSFAESLLNVELDIHFDFALYYSKATEEGLAWGLPRSFQSQSSLFADTEGIIPLAYTELGRLAAFYKPFGERPYAGFVFLRSWKATETTKHDLELIKTVAEFGL